jgi:hypothetical protein
MITDKAREKRITDALQTYNQRAGAKETLPIELRGRQELLPVIELPLDAVLLNAGSHRLRAQLEDHPEGDLVQRDPWSEEAQDVLAELLKTAHRDFAALKASLALEKQRDAGVITRGGVLVNANTRAVALREIEQESKSGSKLFLRVALLPPDVSEPELAELELELQVQKELKDPYTLTNELLFIEDLFRKYNKTAEQIAYELRWASDKKGLTKAAADVEQRRRILVLIREMQQIPSKQIPLTFFDDKLEQLKALENKYNTLKQEDPDGANEYRENWLCAARAGASSVHDLRVVDDEFVGEFLKSRLEEDPEIGPFVGALLAPASDAKRKPKGVDVLDPDAADPVRELDVRKLLDVFSSSQGVSITQPDGKKITFDAKTLQGKIQGATKAVISELKAEGRSKNKLDEPISLLRDAIAKLKKARTQYIAVSKRLGRDRRGKLQYSLAQAKKAVAELEKSLEGSEAKPRK